MLNGTLPILDPSTCQVVLSYQSMVLLLSRWTRTGCGVALRKSAPLSNEAPGGTELTGRGATRGGEFYGVMRNSTGTS